MVQLYKNTNIQKRGDYMKKVGDLLTAFGVVGFLAVVLELVMDWKMISNEMVFLLFIVGSLILLLIGIVFRSIGKSKENKSNK